MTKMLKNIGYRLLVDTDNFTDNEPDGYTRTYHDVVVLGTSMRGIYDIRIPEGIDVSFTSGQSGCSWVHFNGVSHDEYEESRAMVEANASSCVWKWVEEVLKEMEPINKAMNIKLSQDLGLRVAK